MVTDHEHYWLTLEHQQPIGFTVGLDVARRRWGKMVLPKKAGQLDEWRVCIRDVHVGHAVSGWSWYLHL